MPAAFEEVLVAIVETFAGPVLDRGGHACRLKGRDLRQRLGFRPLFSGQLPQILLDPTGQALRVAVLHQNVCRRVGQEALQLLGRALDRQVEAIG